MRDANAFPCYNEVIFESQTTVMRPHFSLSHRRRWLWALSFTLICPSPSFAQLAPDAAKTNRAVTAEAEENVLQIFLKAYAAYQSGDLLRVPGLLKDALELSRDNGDRAGEALALLSQSQMWQKLKQNERAQKLVDEAEAVVKTLPPADAASVWTTWAAVCARAGQRDAGLQRLEQAATLAKGTRVAGDVEFLRGWLLREAGRGEEARNATQAGLALQRASGDRRGELWSLLNLGYLYISTGQSDLALLTLQEAHDKISTAFTAPAAPNSTKTDGGILELLYQLTFQPATLEAKINQALASQLQPAQALPLFERALEIVKTDNPYFAARLTSEIADRQVLLNDLPNARENYERAWKIAEQVGATSVVTVALNGLTRIAAQEKDFASAVKWSLQLSAVNRELGFGDSGNLSYRALLRWQSGDTAPVEAELTQAAQLADAEYADLGAWSAAKLGSGGGNTQSYRRLILWLLTRPDSPQRNAQLAEAFGWIEKTKARTLLDWQNDNALDRFAMLSPAEKARHEAQQQVIEAANTRLVEARLNGKSAEITQAQSELKTAVNQAALLDDQLPSLFQKRGTAQTLGAAQTAHLWGNDSALIHFVLLDDGRLAAVVLWHDANGPQLRAHIYDTPPDEIGEAVADLRAACASPQGKYAFKARALYQMLAAPLQVLAGDKKQWILSPDGPLWELPFAALMSGDKFLGDEHTLSLAYSASFLARYATKTPATQTPRLLIVANPDFGSAARFAATNKRAIPAESRAISADSRAISADSRAISAESRAISAESRAISAESRGEIGDGLKTRTGGITPLPGTQIEAQALKAEFPDAQLLLQKDAQEKRVTDEMAQFDWLHFATHGLLNAALPLQSSLVLAQPNTASEDGFLTASEIARLRLRARLVVLSACDTGRGKQQSGEGILGLTWGFAAAGVPTQIVSQWEVNDASTATWMTEFYRHLKTQSVTDAAQSAAQTLRANDETSHPYYWAPFVVLGQPR